MQNYKYAVDTKVYDNGRVVCSRPFKVDFSFKNVNEELEKFDHYVDTFATLKEANKFIIESKYS